MARLTRREFIRSAALAAECTKTTAAWPKPKWGT
jgi:hypothetical protein